MAEPLDIGFNPNFGAPPALSAYRQAIGYVSPLIIYHRRRPGKVWLKDYEMVALGTFVAGMGTGLVAMLYATGRTKMAAALGVTGALVGAVIAAAQILGDGARAEAEGDN